MGTVVDELRAVMNRVWCLGKTSAQHGHAIDDLTLQIKTALDRAEQSEAAVDRHQKIISHQFEETEKHRRDILDLGNL